MTGHFADQPLTPNSVTAVESVNIKEGMARSDVNNSPRAIVAMVKNDFAANAGTITASATFNLASISTGDYVLMAAPSGGSITSFGAASEGLTKYLECLGTTVFRNSSNLAIQNGADFSASTGDVVIVRALGSTNWKMRIDPKNKIFLDSPNTFTAAQTITNSAAGAGLTLTSIDAGAASGPNIVLDRNSASPAASDNLGEILFKGRDSAGNTETYVDLQGSIVDTTNGSEDGTFYFGTMAAGTLSYWQFLSGGFLHLSATGGGKGVGTINSGAGGIYVNGHGTVAQVVSDTELTLVTSATAIPFDDTIPQSGEGIEVLSIAITPTNASSVLHIDVDVQVGLSTTNTVTAALFVDATANAIDAMGESVDSTTIRTIKYTHVVSAASTSSRTYKVNVGGASGTVSLNGIGGSTRRYGGVCMSTIKVTEILPQ